MKTQTKFLSMAFVATLAFASCMKKPMACCDIPATATHGQPITFNSSCSMNASSYEWDFGDGAKSTDATATHTYAAAGAYTVKLMAMSKNGKQMNDISKPITIN